MSYKLLNNVVGWAVFAIALLTYTLTIEPTGSLWDCGEFIAGAQKLQVVHPPGAPVFLMVGRMFTFIAETVSPGDPSAVARSVNFMSGLCTAFTVLFVFWTTTILGRILITAGDRDRKLELSELIAVLGGGVMAGLTTAFCSSIWFSAVEGEVYAMSTFFTALVVWSGFRWYQMPDDEQSDRWLIFIALMIALSIGVHLLSLLAIPTIAVLFYMKKVKKPSIIGVALSFILGSITFLVIQTVIILKLPSIGAWFDRLFVNSFSAPFGFGMGFFVLILAALAIGGVVFSVIAKLPWLQKLSLGFGMILIGMSMYGMIVIRANADTPINMNDPSDVYSLVSYLNREQYGDRPLFVGPHFAARPTGNKFTDKYGPVGDKYEIVDQKVEYTYRSTDQMFLPRMSHSDRATQYKVMMDLDPNKPLPANRPTAGDNFGFFVKYQIGWMYWRYFMWNFAGRQNNDQGVFSQDVTRGQWLSGIGFMDSARLYDQSNLPETIKNDKSRNKYYMLPFLFGLIGLILHMYYRPNEALALIILFLMTGLAIIFYSNQPPQEPRERDYVLVGSFFTYCMWIGLSIPGVVRLLKDKLPAVPLAAGMTLLVFLAPFFMVTQNWDDHSRANLSAARDYATNFLESCEQNAIVFTHGDNDTYPLWYAQEVEGIRTDVRVVNLSLLAVDWYIDQLRRKVNDSPAIKMTMSPAAYRGNTRNSIPVKQGGVQNISTAVKFAASDNPQRNSASFLPTNKLRIPVNRQQVIQNKVVSPEKQNQIVNEMNFTINKTYLIKDEIAILDILSSNLWERPIYFAVTCRPEKLLGLNNYLQLEGLAMRVVPIKGSGSPLVGGVIGQGSVDEQKMYNNIMTKFKWGGFDKHSLHVDNSLAPSTQSLRLAFIRLIKDLMDQGKKDQAVALCDKYFEAFPHRNFSYTYDISYFLQVYQRAGALENMKEPLRIWAEETADHLRFYQSLEPNAQVFMRGEIENAERSRNDVLALAKQSQDAELQAYIEGIIGGTIPIKD